MQNNLTKSLGILTKKEKRRLISLSILKIFNGLMDMIGILSIIPFLALFLIKKNWVIINILRYRKITSNLMIMKCLFF